MRAIAVTAVILFHAGAWPFASGYVGVDVFFVISGFLIGGTILHDIQASRFSFGRFYARRARRILPALFTVVLSTCLMGWFVLSPAQFEQVGATAGTALLGVSNVSFDRHTDYFHADSRLIPLLMTWSLGVEEQFYLCFPILALLVQRRFAGRMAAVLVALAVMSFLAAIWATYTHPTAAFYLLPYRAWELAIGVILASLSMRGPHSTGSQQAGAAYERSLLPCGPAQEILGAAGLALLAVSICAFDANTSFPGLAALLPVFGTAGLICAEQSWVNRKVLGCRPVVFVGLVSYSWYLWHWPLMSYASNVAFDAPPVRVMLLVAVLAFGLAVLSWRFIEQPFRRGVVRVRPVLLGYAGALAVALACPAAIKFGHGFPGHVPAAVRRIEAIYEAEVSSPCLAGWNDDGPNLSSGCVNARPGQPRIVLIGDSHAAALGPGVRMLAEALGWGYEVLAKSSCTPLVGVSVWFHAQPQQFRTCARFMQAAFDRAVASPDVGTVILAGMWPYPDIEARSGYIHFQAIPPYLGSARGYDLFQYGFERAVARLLAAGKHVVILGDVPEWRFDVSEVAMTEVMPWRAALAPWLWSGAPAGFPATPGLDLVYRRKGENGEFFRSLARRPGVTYIDLFPRFCSDTRCVFKHDDDLLFVDTGHLSPAGARYALKDFR